MESNDIHIVLSSSNEFVPYCATTMASILYNADKSRNIHFYILTCDITDSNKNKLEKLKKIKNCTIEYPTFDENLLDMFVGINMPPHVTKMTYARIFIPDILPQVDKAIFIDADTMVRGDISELYDINLKNHYFGAVEDIGTAAFSKRLWNNNETYYTAGVLLINCKALRDNRYLEQLSNISPDRKKLYLLCDQCVLNDVFHDKFLRISMRYDFYHEWHFYKPNYTPCDPNDYIESLNNPLIIHFCGPDKPWYHMVMHPYKAEYLKYFKMQPFYNKFKLFYIDDYKTRYHKYNFIRLKGISLFGRIKYKNASASKTATMYNCMGVTIFRQENSEHKAALFILGLPIYKKENLAKKHKLSILGIPIYKKKLHNKIKTYILGIRVKTKLVADAIKALPTSTEIQEKIDTIYKRSATDLRFAYMIISSMQAISIHKDVYEKNNGSMIDKQAVLVGCGSTVKNYNYIKGATHVGVNRAFKEKRINFDFLFAQDSFPEGMDEINGYPCTKFYGYLPNETIREMGHIIRRISEVDYKKSNARRYIIEDVQNGHWANNLAIEPLGNFQGCCFSALQFICFCHPKTLYLVGFDCTDVVNTELQTVALNSDVQMRSWKMFKKIAQTIYPDIEIISINPIGLKGLFKDVYTKKYLEEHPEIEVNPSQIID